MHAQGLSSVTQKKGGKKSRSNSGKFYIYNLTWKELKKPPSLHTQKNKSQQSHTGTNSISRCCPVGKAEEREDRLTDTTEGQRELIQAQKRRREASTLGNSCFRREGIPMSHHRYCNRVGNRTEVGRGKWKGEGWNGGGGRKKERQKGNEQDQK